MQIYYILYTCTDICCYIYILYYDSLNVPVERGVFTVFPSTYGKYSYFLIQL